MANQDGSVIIKVDLNLDDFNKTEKESQKLADNLSKNFSKAGTAVANGIKTAFDVTMKAIAATSAAVTAASAIGLNYNMEMENYLADFEVMLGSAEKAANHVEQLKEMSAKTPFEMTDLAQADKVLLAFGSTADNVAGQLQMLGDISLGNSQKLGTLATAFGRIQSNGRASLEEINMMIDQGFNPLAIIAQKTGETMADVRERVSKGSVSFDEIAEAMKVATSAGGQFYKGMEVASKTASGQISTLKDNVNALLGDLTEGLFDGLKEELLPRVTEAVEEIHNAFNEGGAGAAIETAGNIIKEFMTEITAKAPGAITSFFKTMLPKLKEIGRSMTLALVESMLGENIASKLSKLFDAFDDAFSDLIGVIAEHSGEITGAIEKIIEIVLEIAEFALPLFIDGITWLIDHLDELEPLLLAISAAFVGIKAISAVQGIISGISSAFSALNCVLMANPIAAAIGLVAGAFGAIVSLDRLVSDRIQEDAAAFAALSDAEQEAVDRTNEYIDSWEKVKDISREKSDAATSEYDYYQTLSDELKTIVDSEGKIIRGYEDRAQVITTTLANALGVEVEIIDGQIQGYQELQAEIDKTIQKKLGEAQLAAYAEQYESALKNQSQLEKDHLTTLTALNKKQKEYAEFQEKVSEAKRQWIELGYIEEDLLEEIGGNFEVAGARLEALDKTITQTTKDVEESEKAVLENKSTLQLYGDAVSSLERGELADFNDAILMLGESMMTAETASKESLHRQLLDQIDILEQMEQGMKDGSLAITKAEIDEQKRRVELATIEYNRAANAAVNGGKLVATSYAAGIEDGKAPVSESIGHLNQEVSTKAGVDLKPKGKAAGSSYVTGIKQGGAPASEEMSNIVQKLKDKADVSLKTEGKNVLETFADGLKSKEGFLAQTMSNILANAGIGTGVTLTKPNYNFDAGPPGSESVYSLRYTPVDIPMLAKGAVIPPNSPYLAVVGDQKHGTNIEAPLDTIKQAVIEALGGNGGSREVHVHLSLSGRQIYEVIVDENESNTIATGVNALA